LVIGGLDAQQRNAELKDCVWWNGVRNAGVTICEVRTHACEPLTTHAHAFDTVFQPSGDPSLTDSKRAFLVLLRTITAIQEEAVFNLHDGSSIRSRAISNL